MAGEKKHITRNRISYSCQKCRQRKVKCDKVHPICGSCQRMGEECVYSNTESDQHSNHDTQPVDVGHGKKRKQSLTEPHQEDSEHDDTSRGGSDLQDQLLQLSVLLNQLGRVAGGTGIQASKDTNHAHNEVLTPESQQSYYEGIASRAGFSPTQPTPGSKGSRKDTQQNGAPDLDSISTQLDQLTELLRSKQFDVPKNVSPNRNPSWSNVIPSQTGDHNREDAFRIPSETQRNVLFRCWLSSVYPVLPIVEPALALMHYRTFHFWYQYGLEKGTPNPCEEFVPLIFAIYFAGLMSMSPRGIRKWFPGISRQHVLRAMRKQFSHSLKIPAKLLSSPVVLAARVMMCYIAPQDSDEVGMVSTSSPLVRTAYSCNLHRERMNESLEEQRAEMRRRLWWEIINLDTLEAIASNMPPTINHHFCDTLMLREIKDYKLGTPEANQYDSKLQEGGSPDAADDPSNSSRSSMISVFYLFMKVRTTLASNGRRLLNINLAAKPKTKEDMVEIRRTLQEVHRYVSSNIDRIPTKGIPEHDFTPKPAKPGQSISLDYGNVYGEDLLSSEVEAIRGSITQFEPWELPYIAPYKHAVLVFHKWARIVLSMLMDQLHCFSYAPFLRNTKRKLWITARQCALRNAHSCIRKFNCLATDLELEQFRWTWPCMYQPIHACIILLLDCYENPTSREAPRSRALFDQMLSLSSPEHGIVGGDDGSTNLRPLQDSGNEAFVMLLQLRAKGWHKAGLDPSLLWTEQDQIDIGIATPLTEGEQMAQNMREDKVFDDRDPNSNKATSEFFRPIMQERAKEHLHPSEAGIPDETDHASTYHECTTAMGPTNQTGKDKYKHARPNQQQAPSISRANMNTLQNQSGHVYKFTPPSELYDIGELIRKIRSVQQKKSDKPTGGGANDNVTNEEEQGLSRQIATANNDLTRFLASKMPDGSAGPSSAVEKAIDDDETITRMPSLQGRAATHFQPQLQQYQNPVLPPTVPGPSTTTAAANPKTFPPLPSVPPTAANLQSRDRVAADMTMPNLISMDFDWEKWDEVFGRILDDDGEGGFRDGSPAGGEPEEMLVDGTFLE